MGSSLDRVRASSARLPQPDSAMPEDAQQRISVAAAVQIAIGIDDGARAARESGEAVELKVAFDDNAVGALATQCFPNVPQDRAPDFSVGVLVPLLFEVVIGGVVVEMT